MRAGHDLVPTAVPTVPGRRTQLERQRHTAVGNRVTQGFGGSTVVCDGTPQTVNVQVTASQYPFKHGAALVTATMMACDATFVCHSASDSEEVTFTK